MPSSATRAHRTAITLLEMMVVLAVIGVLLAILFPAIQRARATADKLRCAARLGQLGQAIEMYRDAHGRYPNAVRFPIEGASPVLQQVLGPYIEHSTSVFGCPSDHNYFPQHGISYEYSGITVANKRWEEVTSGNKPSHKIWVLADCDPFHQPRGPYSRNILFLDGHVGP